MKYVLLLMGNLDDARCGATDDAPKPDEFMDFDAELERAGVLAGGFALEDPETAVSVTVPDQGVDPVVTSGPFAESREFVGGTIVIDVPNIDEAIAWARRCPGARGGRVEIRVMLEF